jgi:hypothetical protein
LPPDAAGSLPCTAGALKVALSGSKAANGDAAKLLTSSTVPATAKTATNAIPVILVLLLKDVFSLTAQPLCFYKLYPKHKCNT